MPDYYIIFIKSCNDTIIINILYKLAIFYICFVWLNRNIRLLFKYLTRFKFNIFENEANGFRLIIN